MPRKSKKKPAQEPVPEQKTEQPPASIPAAEPIMKTEQLAPNGTEPLAEKPAETNSIAAPAEAKTAEVAIQPDTHIALDPRKTAMDTTIPSAQIGEKVIDEHASAAATEPETAPPTVSENENEKKDPPIEEDVKKTAASIETSTLKHLETGSILTGVNMLAAATGRQQIFGITPKRALPPETDPSTMAPELKDAVTKLKHARVDVRIEAMFWISSMKDASAAVPSLIRLLNDKDDSVRSNAAWAIGRIGKDANVALPFLLDALDDRCCDVRRFAATALGEIGDQSATEPLNTLAKTNKDWMLRQAINAALKKLNGQKK
jgi:hypothetical protein